MFQNNITKFISPESKRFITTKHINLEKSFDLYVNISSKNENFNTVIWEKILEYTLDKISPVNTYKDLQIALENINAVIHSWEEKIEGLKVFIGIQNREEFFFSHIGKIGIYLIRKDGEVIEISEKKSEKNSFQFISSGNIETGEGILISSQKILNYLTVGDLQEIPKLKDPEQVTGLIEQILSEERIKKSIGLIYIKNVLEEIPKDWEKPTEKILTLLQEKGTMVWEKILDTKIGKSAIALFQVGQDKISQQNKKIKNIIFLTIIFISFFFLYGLISSILWNNSSNEKNLSFANLEEAKTYIRIASENIQNPDIFNLNIKKAEEKSFEIKDKQFFLSDIEKLYSDISILKRQFNNVSIFEELDERKIYTWGINAGLKLLSVKNKTYIIETRGIKGPIIGTDIVSHPFNALDEDDEFIDATVLNDIIVLLTKKNKIVEFQTNGFYKFADVNDQDTWETSNKIASYGNNIYLYNPETKQITRHKRGTSGYAKGTAYFKPEDTETIWNALAIGIDGGFYILKEDLSMIKFFANPSYRIESLLLNKLPRNYNKETNSPIRIKTGGDKNYVYMLLNNKIWVFQPNTKQYQNTKSLEYIGQIEWKQEEIIDFIINKNEIILMNKTGVYKIAIEINDGQLSVR